MNRPPLLARLQHPAWRREAHASLTLSVRLLLGQVALMLMPVADIFALAPLGAPAMAAVGLLNSFSALLLLFCFGLMQAMAPLSARLSQTVSRQDMARQVFAHGLLLAAAIGCIAAVTTQAFPMALGFLGQDPIVLAQARSYAMPLSLALVPAACLCAWRVSFPLQGRSGQLALILVACSLLHALTNWMLVHGLAAAPGSRGLGVAGVGWSYVISYGLTVLLLAHLDRATVTTALGTLRRPSPADSGFWSGQLLEIGLPIGAVMALEYTLFTGANLLMGAFGSNALAAHALCLQWVTLACILPLALSHTVLTRLSLALGGGAVADVRRVVLIACAVACVFHGLIGSAFLLMPRELLTWMLPSGMPQREALLQLATPFMQLAALVQAFNGISVVLAAVLRACRDTRAPLLQVFAGYWIAGLGGAWLLSRFAGPIGIWLGMALGFGLTVILLVRRVRHRLLHLPDLFTQPEFAHAQSR